MPKETWVTKTARQLSVGDTLIRNVEPGMEWVPGPYGAFVVMRMHWRGDEVTIYTTRAWSATAQVTIRLDGEEDVVVKEVTH